MMWMDFSLQSPPAPHIKRSPKSPLETGTGIRNVLISISDKWFPSQKKHILIENEVLEQCEAQKQNYCLGPTC